MRVAIYTDAVYEPTPDGGHTVDETFVVFAADLRDHVDRLVLVGRSRPATDDRANGVDRPDAAHRSVLRNDVEVVGLPDYDALTDLSDVATSLAASLRRFWRVLDEVDAVWLLGPHPYAIMFALVTLIRRRRLVLGVRQDFPAHQRNRHPGRPLVHAVADGLEGAWRLISWRRPTVAVGPDLARRYRHARPVVDAVISLTTARDLIPPEVAAARSYDGVIELLWVGRIDPEKNPMLLVDVLRLLDRRRVDWRLTICGDGSLVGELEQRLVEAGVAERVTFAGFVDLETLRQHYRVAHVLTHVSLTEGVPQVLFEAFAAGLPVAATDVGGVGAVAGSAALVVPPDDAAAMANAVERLVRDRQLREERVARGLELAAVHTADNQRALIADLFEQVMRGAV